MNAVSIRCMDYRSMELITVRVEVTFPKPGFIKLFDQSDQELTGVERLQFYMDDSAKLYEISFVHKGEERSATIINLEQCNNTSISSDSSSKTELEKQPEQS